MQGCCHAGWDTSGGWQPGAGARCPAAAPGPHCWLCSCWATRGTRAPACSHMCSYCLRQPARASRPSVPVGRTPRTCCSSGVCVEGRRHPAAWTGAELPGGATQCCRAGPAAVALPQGGDSCRAPAPDQAAQPPLCRAPRRWEHQLLGCSCCGRMPATQGRPCRRAAQGAGGEPVVSLQSFLWAHCLVRSRALQLLPADLDGGAPAHLVCAAEGSDGPGPADGTRQQLAARQLRCMLPGVDMCAPDACSEGLACSCMTQTPCRQARCSLLCLLLPAGPCGTCRSMSQVSPASSREAAAGGAQVQPCRRRRCDLRPGRALQLGRAPLVSAHPSLPLSAHATQSPPTLLPCHLQHCIPGITQIILAGAEPTVVVCAAGLISQRQPEASLARCQTLLHGSPQWAQLARSSARCAGPCT